MEKFQELRYEAKKRIKLADHMLTQTYPIVKDPKFLLTIAENLFLALSYSFTSVLYYEKMFKRAGNFHDTFEGKMEAFKTHCVPRYGIEKKYLTMIRELRNTLIEHKKSPIEFARNDKFVICSDEYSMRMITSSQLKNNLADAKVFIEEMSNITTTNEDIFT